MRGGELHRGIRLTPADEVHDATGDGPRPGREVAALLGRGEGDLGVDPGVGRTPMLVGVREAVVVPRHEERVVVAEAELDGLLQPRTRLHVPVRVEVAEPDLLEDVDLAPRITDACG